MTNHDYSSSSDHGQVKIIDNVPKRLIPLKSLSSHSSCCTIFAPDRPRPIQLKNAEQYEQRMDVEALVERAVAGIIVTEITPKAEKDGSRPDQLL